MEEKHHNIDETLGNGMLNEEYGMLNEDLNQQSASDNQHLTPSDLLLVELVRMADKRHTEACPDAAVEWQRVVQRIDGGTEMGNNECEMTNEDLLQQPQKSTLNTQHSALVTRLRIYAVVVTSVAAVLAGVLIFVAISKFGSDGNIVALNYDETPQRITLTQGDDQITDLSGKDSVTYYNMSHSVAPREVKEQRLSTPRGMDFKLTLPDGSEVWLNAESTIKFPSSFITGERRVELSGEAYFKIAHNARKPFTVTTGQMDVRVLGTEFNMRSYKSEATRVSLIKGSVEIINPENKQTECRLKPGQDAWRDSKGALHVSQVDTYSVTQWVEGFFYFDDVPLLTVLRDIGRWYNLGVVFNNSAVANSKLHFSASRKDDINETLNSLSNIVKTHISVEGTNIVVK